MMFKIALRSSGEFLFEGMLSECINYCEENSYWIVKDDGDINKMGETWYVEYNQSLWDELRRR